MTTGSPATSLTKRGRNESRANTSDTSFRKFVLREAYGYMIIKGQQAWNYTCSMLWLRPLLLEGKTDQR